MQVHQSEGIAAQGSQQLGIEDIVCGMVDAVAPDVHTKQHLHTPFMELGLNSLDLVCVSEQLSEQFNQSYN